MAQHSSRPPAREKIDWVGKGLPLEQLVSDKAHQVAEELAGKRSPVTASQLRAFFHGFRALEAQIADDPKNFQRVLPRLKMMRAVAAYRYRGGGRDAKIPESFYHFLEDNVREINTIDDFKRFMLYFEAVVGFCYGKGVREGR